MAVLPNSSFGSTTFASNVTSYELLAERVKRTLGAPLIEIEISDEQLFTNIDIACEFFTKFAGVTEEFLIFRSDLYVKGVGLPIGRLLNITPDMLSVPNPDAPPPKPTLQLTEFETIIGNGVDKEYTIEHGLNDDNILAQVYSNITEQQIFVQVKTCCSDKLIITFDEPPAIDSVRVVVLNGANKYVTVLDDGPGDEHIINHNLNDENVIIQAYNDINDHQVFVTIKNSNANTSVVEFDNDYQIPVRVVILAGIAKLRYVSVIGSCDKRDFVIKHNLKQQDVIVQVFDLSTKELVYPAIKIDTENEVVISFTEPPQTKIYKVVIYKGDEENTTLTSAGWDFDMNDYRRVVDVYSFSEGNNSGINALFTIEHTIAQQAYFGHLLGNVGYDLITWQALKGWLDLREKVLGLTPYLRFNPDTQMLKITPEPTSNSVYYGLVACKVQKPIKDIVSQLWIYRYVLALSKITIGHVRGKYTGTNLFGGQQVNYADLMSQGLAEKEKLETEIITDMIDRDPIKFFIG